MKTVFLVLIVIFVTIFAWEKWVRKWLKKIKEKHNF